MALAMVRPWKHPKTGIYWLCKRVPDELQAAVGKREEKFSLKTRDPAEAKRVFAASLVALEERWGNLRAPVRNLDNSELHHVTLTTYQRCSAMKAYARHHLGQ
jgi:hypothetical protein